MANGGSDTGSSPYPHDNFFVVSFEIQFSVPATAGYNNKEVFVGSYLSVSLALSCLCLSAAKVSYKSDHFGFPTCSYEQLAAKTGHNYASFMSDTLQFFA
jgi:hypothetical protein